MSACASVRLPALRASAEAHVAEGATPGAELAAARYDEARANLDLERGDSDLAAALGSAPRAVGRACGRNPIPIVIPCHRVLGKGWLGGYSGSGGVDTKQALLTLEGAL